MLDPKPMVKPARFVELLEREVRRGFSVIPLVGSGISAPSGVLTGEAFGSYLLCCVWDALRTPAAEDSALSLRDGIWPRTYPPDDIAAAREWISDRAAQLRENYPPRATMRSPVPPILATLSPLEQEAIGALADWRSTLFFLSRLRRADHGERGSLYDDLGPPDPKVVDSFNHHITRGHTYNLGHQMLSFLARLLRIRTVLTTNFDTLLEQAFAAAHLRLDVFDVHIAGNLPDPRLVRSQLSLIKLHGSRFETRADLSLDSTPGDDDRTSFVRYFHGDGASLPAHLLVLGFSGRDRRIMTLMGELASRNRETDPSSIFWICHRREDVARVVELARRFEFARSIVVTAGRADLLLFELYQRFVSTLPPAGSTYEFAQYIPPLAGSLYRDLPEPLTQLLRAIDEKAYCWAGPSVRIDCESSSGEETPGRVIVVRGASGTSSLAELAFTQLTASGRNALWFELDDFCGVDDLAACILQCIAAQRGQLDLNVVTLSPHDLDQEAVRRHFHIEPREWVLFLYGRQSAGTSAGWDNRPWPALEFQRLSELVRVLEKIGFTIIYLPLSSDRRTSIIRSIRKSLKVEDGKELTGGAQQLVETFVVDPCLRDYPIDDDAHAESLLSREPADVLKEVAKWSQSGGMGTDLLEKRCRFLYVMTLFRQSRHLSALASEAALPDPARFNTDGLDNDRERMDEVERWTSQLAEIGLLRRKEGGFLWMHRDLRETLRILLEEPDYGWIPGNVSFLPKRSRSHHWLAEWYLRAFRATGNFTPFVESFYHRLQCIIHLEEAEVPKHLRQEYLNVVGTDDARAREKYRSVECEINLREAAKLLNSGKRVPVLNLEEVQRKALFSELPPALEPIARKYNCLPLYEDLDNIRGRLRTLASLQSRDPESVSGALATSAGARGDAQGIAWNADDINAWEAEYTHIKSRVQYDQFHKTRTQLIELLNRLGFSIAGLPDQASIRRATVDSIVNRRPSVQWRLIIKVLRRLAHLYLKETAIAYHLHEIDGWTDWVERGPLQGTSDAKHHAATASSLLLAAERSGWFLDPSFRDSQMIESVACLSLHGLALGYLDRFTEAQRKIDEASGALASSSLAHDPLELAILELRRSLLFLLEARSIRVQRIVPNTKPIDLADAPRSASARVEDAWRCVERAHELLSGNSRIVSWWERLYTTQLRALAMNQELSRADPRYRALLGYPDASREESATLAYRSALLLRPRRTRVVARACHYYFLSAEEPSGRKRVVARCLEVLHKEKRRIEDTPDSDLPDPIVLEYFHGVLNRLEAADRSLPAAPVVLMPRA